MELKKIKEIMVAMTRNKTKKFRIKEGDFELELERECQFHENDFKYFLKESRSANSGVLPEMDRPHEPGAALEIPKSLHPPINHNETPVVREGDQFVTSPMVGTFYLTSSPDEPYFVKDGDSVDKNSIVCIIEAMKVMNEVKAGVDGTVSKILVENGHPVEFGTKLFIISKKT